MASIEELKKRAYEQTMNRKAEEEKNDEEFSSYVQELKKRASSGTVQIGTNLGGSNVSNWYSSVSSLGKRAYDYLSYDGYKAPNTSFLDEIDKYLEQERDVAQYIRANRAAFDDFDSTIQNHYDSVNYLRQLRNSIQYNNNYFSQWGDADAYNTYIAEQKDREEKSRFDIVSGEQEISDLEAKKDELISQSRSVPAGSYLQGGQITNTTPYAAGLQAQRNTDPAHESISDLNKQISDKTQYLNDAKRIQEGIALAGTVNNDDFEAYSGYVSTYNDGPFSKLITQYGMGYDDLTYEYINNQNGIRDEIEGKDTLYGYETSASESPMKKKGYDLLTETEISTYNYYYAKDGKEKAQEYLDSIQDDLNIRKSNSMYEIVKDNTLLELAFGVVAGLDQFSSGIKGTWSTITGDDDYIPVSATQIASGMVREDLSDVGPNLPDWAGGASIGQVGYDTITTTANMAPSILTSIAANYFIPGSGAFVGNTMMFASAGGNAYQEALNLGYDKNQARMYGALVGASEAGLQYLLGGVSQLGGKLSGNVVTKILNGVDNAFARTAIKLGGEMMSEGIEEGLQEILTPMFQNLVFYADEDVNWSEVAYSALLGALTAGLLEGKSTISGEVNTYKVGKSLQNADISAQRLAEIGNTFAADTVAYQLAGRVNENTGAYTLGRLFNEIGATMTEQNVSEITNALVDAKIDKRIARKNAEVFAYVVEGGQLSNEQIAVIEANEPLAAAVRNTIIDQNTTWNQRSRSYNEVLMDLAREKVSSDTSRTNPADAGEDNAHSDVEVDSNKETGVQSNSEALNVDTSPDKAQSISSIKDGKAIIRLEDGREVETSKADLSPDEGVRIETIAQIDGITANDANFILNTLRTSTNASAQMDALGAKEAYKYGFYGFSMNHLTQYGVFANSLTDAQKQAIYETGRNARNSQAKTAKNTSGGKQTGIYFDAGNGEVIAFKDANKKLTDKQNAGVKAAMILNKLGIGGDIYFFESYRNSENKLVYKDKNGKEVKAPNGWYSEADGSIHIDLNAGANADGLVLYTLSHELTHFIEQWSPQKYKILADFLVENYEKGQSMDAIVRAKQRELQRLRGKKVSYREAYSEVVADSMEAMLSDGNVLEKLIELKAKDNDLFSKMKQFFDNILKKIRSIYNGLTPDSVEGRAVLEMADSIERIQQLFADALVDASEKFQSAGKNTTADGGGKYQFRGYAEDGRGVYESNFPKGTPKKAKAARILSLIQDVWSKKPITLRIEDENGTKYIVAEFDPTYDETGRNTDASKLMGGNRHGTSSEQRVTLDLADDYYQIAEESTYNYSKEETGKDSETHKDVRYWHYFINDIYFSEYGSNELVPYRVSINVKEKTDGNFFYSFSAEKMEETSTQRTLHAAVSSSNETATNGDLFSVTLTPEAEIVKPDTVETLVDSGIVVDSETDSGSIFSVRYVLDDTGRENVAKSLVDRFGVTKEEAMKWLKAETSLASLILNPKYSAFLDYFADPDEVAIKQNSDYPQGTVDFSNICKKRREFTQVMNRVLRNFPSHVFAATDLAKIRTIMGEEGMTLPCGICYVEDRRQLDTIVAQDFIDALKLYREGSKTRPDGKPFNANQLKGLQLTDGDTYVPTIYELVSLEGRNSLKAKNPDMEAAWVRYNNARGMQSVRLLTNEAEYKRQILKYSKKTVQSKNDHGGLRIYSFSDAEMFHLIDIIQVITDSAAVGLSLQGYTKVNEYAKAVKDTGEKLNRSLIPKGDLGYHVENGKVVLDYDTVEGIDITSKDFFDNKDNPNVGNITIGVNDIQIRAAMVSDFVDQIIPFHTGQSEEVLGEKGIAAWKNYKDFQTEKDIATGKTSSHQVNIYTEVIQAAENDGKPIQNKRQFVEKFLEVCKKNGLQPRFSDFLNTDAQGNYIYTEGYHKFLVDFKTFAQTEIGEYLPQMPVKPIFDNAYITGLLKAYVNEQQAKDADVAKKMPKVIERITNEIIKPEREVTEFTDDYVKYSERVTDKKTLDFLNKQETITTYKTMQLVDGKLYPPMAARTNGAYEDYSVLGEWEQATEHPELIKNGNKFKLDKGKGQGSIEASYNPYMHSSNLVLNDQFSGAYTRGNLVTVECEVPVSEVSSGYHAKYAKDSVGWHAWHTGTVAGSLRKARGIERQVFLSRWIKPVRIVPDSEVAVMYKKLLSGTDIAVPDNVVTPSLLTELKKAGVKIEESGRVKYQDRNTDSVSNRSLLANAFEGIAQNDMERNKIKEYKGKIDLINAEEEKLHRLNSQIRDLSFAKGTKDTKKIRQLRDEATMTANRINIYDRQLLRLESSEPLQDVLKREKEMVRKREQQKGREALEAYRLKAESKQSEILRDYRETRAALREQKSETATMEREFIRIVKAYEKLEAKYTAKSGEDEKVISDLKDALREETKNHRYDQKAWETEFNRLLREYEAADRNIDILEAKIEHQKQMAKKKVYDLKRTAMRHKIKDVVNELNQYLLNGTKDRHVPIELQKAVAESLDAVNMDTVGAQERIAKLQAELMKAKTPEKIQEISRKIDNIQAIGDKMNGRLQKLKDAYDQFVNSDDPLIANSHDEVISNKLQSVIETVGDTPLRDMTMSQLEDVYDMYRMVLTTIRNANKAFKAKKSESISTIANRVMMEVEKVGGKKKLSMKGMEGIKSFGWNNLKPVYAFEHIGSGTFTEVFNHVRNGEDVWAVDITEAREFYLDKVRKHNYDSWDFKKRYKFTSTSGMDFELSIEQIMSLYAYSKREQAADHLKKGGIVIDETTDITVKNKLGIPVKFNPTEATAYNISDETLADIISKLSNEQKSFVDEMQEYLSTVMGAKGNEISLELYGIKLFKEKFYFPLKSAQQFMAKAKEQAQGEVKIKNSGFSRETVHKASNPIVLTPFMNVWANHVNEMSMYHAFVLPMEDFYRVYNYKTPTSDTMATESVEMFIQNAYGKGATKYIDQLLKDLNGGAMTDSRTGVINKMMGLFKKGAVFASLSVVIQQPSAIARAAALVDTKYFIGPKIDHKRHKALWEEVKKYAPVAIIKEMGYFDTNMGKSTEDFILGKEYSGITEKMKALVTDSGYRDEVLSKAPALADEIAWSGIWEAVKRETKAKNPGMDYKSEAFLKKSGERFTEVITKTQVYDSVLARSANMRSKDTGMKMTTAFMAEPTTSINMIADALLQGKRGNIKYARKAIGAVIASQILNSILVSFVYAGRDDDEDKTYLEKYIGALTGEIIDSLNPAGYIPFIKDIISIVQGYDVERSDMAVVSDLWKAWQNLSKDNVSVYRKVEGFAGSIAQIFGLPVKNIMRDARGIYQTIMSFMIGQKTTRAGIEYAVKSSLPKWIGGGDVSNQNQLYQAYLSGDREQISRVESRYNDQSAINSAIRKALRENDPRIREAAIAWNANDLDEYMRIAKEIIAEKHFVQDDVVLAIRAEANALTTVERTASTSNANGLFTADKFAEAIAQGDQAMANAIKVDMIQTAKKNGKSEEEAQNDFASSATSACKNLFLSGGISEDQAIHALETYCDKTEDEAMADVMYWAFKRDYPNVYADDQWFDTYYAKIADSGIGIDVYMNYRNQVASITGEDKKERRMAVINSLPITSAQKDALYRAEGWAESKLSEAPWH